MYSERESTKELTRKFQITNTEISRISGVSKPKVSNYFHDLRVNPRDCEQIQTAVTDLSLLISTLVECFGIRPDLRDPAMVKNAILETKIGVEHAHLRAETERASEELLAGLSASAK